YSRANCSAENTAPPASLPLSDGELPEFKPAFIFSRENAIDLLNTPMSPSANSHKAATAAGNVPKRQHDWRAAFAFCGLDFFATFFVKKKSGTDHWWG
ncbi:MAG: hypothetical protein QM610_01785, partial [Chitinophagaceae bacterium]